MQVLIDIPEKDVPNSQEIMTVNLHFITGEVCECSYPYLVLPKGHGRLIDADAKDLQSELWTFTRYTGIDEAPYEDACMALDKAPTIVEAEGSEE